MIDNSSRLVRESKHLYEKWKKTALPSRTNRETVTPYCDVVRRLDFGHWAVVHLEECPGPFISMWPRFEIPTWLELKSDSDSPHFECKLGSSGRSHHWPNDQRASPLSLNYPYNWRNATRQLRHQILTIISISLKNSAAVLKIEVRKRVNLMNSLCCEK